MKCATLSLAVALLAFSRAVASSTQGSSSPGECCMGELLSEAGLSSKLAASTKELFRKNGVDQRVFLTDDYNAVAGLLKELGIDSPLDVFHIYSGLHRTDAEVKTLCSPGQICQLNSASEFMCQQNEDKSTREPSGLETAINEVRKLEQQLSKVEAKNDTITTSFTRWGRSECPSSSTLVYSGWVGGAYHSDLGSGANPQCMPKTPTYGRYSDYQWGGIMYPAVYKMQGQNEPWHAENTDRSATCAVCESRGRSTSIMMPGRNTCPDGWTREYYGYLTSANFNIDHRSMFLCFDDQIEAGDDISSSYATHHLYVAAVDCRNSPMCPPYYNARELTCAVCSR
eukprot:scpid68756/ scgid33707/ 